MQTGNKRWRFNRKLNPKKVETPVLTGTLLKYQ